MGSTPPPGMQQRVLVRPCGAACDMRLSLGPLTTLPEGGLATSICTGAKPTAVRRAAELEKPLKQKTGAGERLYPARPGSFLSHDLSLCLRSRLTRMAVVA
jgi:hypothetical protein